MLDLSRCVPGDLRAGSGGRAGDHLEDISQTPGLNWSSVSGGEGKVDYIPSCMHFEEAIISCPTVRKDVFIRLRGIGSHPVNDFKI